MKTVETKTARLHKLAITVDLHQEDQILDAINLLVEKLGKVPVLLDEEQAQFWAKKMEKPYHFCFIKAYAVAVGCGLCAAKKAIEGTQSFNELWLHPVTSQRLWEVFYEKLEDRKDQIEGQQ